MIFLLLSVLIGPVDKQLVCSYNSNPFDHSICNGRCGGLRNISLCVAVIRHNI